MLQTILKHAVVVVLFYRFLSLFDIFLWRKEISCHYFIFNT